MPKEGVRRSTLHPLSLLKREHPTLLKREYLQSITDLERHLERELESERRDAEWQLDLELELESELDLELEQEASLGSCCSCQSATFGCSATCP